MAVSWLNGLPNTKVLLSIKLYAIVMEIHHNAGYIWKCSKFEWSGIICKLVGVHEQLVYLDRKKGNGGVHSDDDDNKNSDSSHHS